MNPYREYMAKTASNFDPYAAYEAMKGTASHLPNASMTWFHPKAIAMHGAVGAGVGAATGLIPDEDGNRHVARNAAIGAGVGAGGKTVLNLGRKGLAEAGKAHVAAVHKGVEDIANNNMSAHALSRMRGDVRDIADAWIANPHQKSTGSRIMGSFDSAEAGRMIKKEMAGNRQIWVHPSRQTVFTHVGQDVHKLNNYMKSQMGGESNPMKAFADAHGEKATLMAFHPDRMQNSGLSPEKQQEYGQAFKTYIANRGAGKSTPDAQGFDAVLKQHASTRVQKLNEQVSNMNKTYEGWRQRQSGWF